MSSNDLIVCKTADQINAFQLLAQRGALKMELLGMRHSAGSVYAIVKKTYGFKGNKQKVYDQFNQYVENVLNGNK